MTRLGIYMLLLSGLVFILAGQGFAYEKLSDGVVLKLDKKVASGISRLKIEVCGDELIRVVASPADTFSARPSLMRVPLTGPAPEWSVLEKGGEIEIATAKLKVRVNKQNGAVSFHDAHGKLILAERSEGGRIITPATVMDEKTFHVRQLFHSPADEAFYGLGSHQNDVMNYKGHDVDLFQLNIVDVNPFLVSNRNYGLLWDNNSQTRFGDCRDFKSLADLALFDKNGAAGGLTAEYFRTPDFQQLYTSRSEPRIEHEFIDVNDPFPAGFRENVASIRYSGQIEAPESGEFKFRLYSSGFVKMWLNGELVADTYRQNWLPWTTLPRLIMQAGKRYDLKIEWIHMGGYLGLKYLPPDRTTPPNTLSLWSQVGDQIDYYFVHGETIDQLIHGYRTLTGHAPLMPKWVLGLWQSRQRYTTQKELLSVVKEFREREIPFDTIVLDWFYWQEDQWGSHEFDPTRFPDPKGMVDALHNDLHAQIMISVWPKFYVGTEHYNEFDSRGWLYPRNVLKKERDWVGPGYTSSFYDPYGADARQLYWDQINEHLFSKGFDAWWLDATEPDIHSNLSLEETRLRIGPTALGTAARYLNSYTLVHSGGIYENQRKTDPDKRVFILTRSVFAGQQRYATATWSGDIVTRWYDMKAQISAGLNFNISGVPWWTMDIGGFSVEPRFERNVKPEDLEEWREFNARWFQFGTFIPLLRVHGEFPYREMFNIAPAEHPAYQAMLAYDKLRYRLMPYLYSLAAKVSFEDYTMMRALVMDFGQDKKVKAIGDQYMFGPALLINPVTQFKARARALYLPAGTGWYNLKTGAFQAGGKSIIAEAPLAEIPIFVREGSIIPFGPELQYTMEKQADPIRLYVYTGRDGEFTIYEDEGINYNYEKGQYAMIPVTWSEKERKLTLGPRKGRFPGMLNERTFEVIWVSAQNAARLDFTAAPAATVQYSGSAVTIPMK
jgi:alpha-D-xyloside xylohydrolase